MITWGAIWATVHHMHFDENAKGLPSNLQNLSYINQLITSDWPFSICRTKFSSNFKSKHFNGKAVIDRNVLSFPKSSSPAHFYSLNPAGLQSNEEQYQVCVSVPAHTCVCELLCICCGIATRSAVAECNPRPLPDSHEPSKKELN